MQGTAELHVLHQVGALTLIRGDDANLVRFGSGFQQPSGDLLNVGSLSPENTNKPYKLNTEQYSAFNDSCILPIIIFFTLVDV